MKKISAIAIVLLVCALLLGVGGGFLLVSENTESIDGAPTDIKEMTFCQPGDPGCGPGDDRDLVLFCQPGDPGCGPGD